MTLDEAIEYLQTEALLLQAATLPKRQSAIKLGIEALKRIKEGRQGYSISIVCELPGETK